MLLCLFWQHFPKRVPSLEVVQRHLHESRSFISKGIVSTAFYEFVHQVCRVLSDTNAIITQVFNYIYQQVFTLLWKPRCAKVIAYEQTLGLNNRNKRAKHRSTSFNYTPTHLHQPASSTVDDTTRPPWVNCFTASIRQGLTWLNYVYTPQAAMFRSFTTAAINSFTNPSNNDTEYHVVDRNFLRHRQVRM